MARSNNGNGGKRIYYVTSKSGEGWLVRAVSQSQAYRNLP